MVPQVAGGALRTNPLLRRFTGSCWLVWSIAGSAAPLGYLEILISENMAVLDVPSVISASLVPSAAQYWGLIVVPPVNLGWLMSIFALKMPSTLEFVS